MTMPSQTSKPFELRGSHVLWICVAFFAAVFAINGVMIYAAVESFPGTERISSYQAGRLYPREIEKARAQAERQWQADAHIERRADGRVDADIRFQDAQGRAVSGLQVELKLVFPAASGHDSAVTLIETAAGRYRANFGPVAAGQWEAAIEAKEKDQTLFRSQSRVILR